MAAFALQLSGRISGGMETITGELHSCLNILNNLDRVMTHAFQLYQMDCKNDVVTPEDILFRTLTLSTHINRIMASSQDPVLVADLQAVLKSVQSVQHSMVTLFEMKSEPADSNEGLLIRLRRFMK